MERKLHLNHLPENYPIKFTTTKCRITCAKIKSPKLLSGLISLNSSLF